MQAHNQECFTLGIRTGESILSVIVPIRVEHSSAYRLDRLQNAIGAIQAGQEVIVVDDGSPAPYATRIAEICEVHGYRNLRLETEHKFFSIGRARNHGAANARTKYILFQDVDLIPCSHFYERALVEIEAQRLDHAVEDLIMFGVIYLSDAGTQEFISRPEPVRDATALEWLFANDQRVVKFSTGTSVVIMHRLQYLAIGGTDEEFCGWGYEDIECNIRAMRRSLIFPMPTGFGLDRGSMSEQFSFHGWKSVYRLFGDRTFAKGIFLIHADHPVDLQSDYHARSFVNKTMFDRKVKERGESLIHWPTPAPTKVDEASYLIFRSNAFTNNPILPAILGRQYERHEDSFSSLNEFWQWIEKHQIKRILFFNPYGSDRLRQIYRECRERDFPYFVAERGALPDAIFFDRSGFLNDSNSYLPEHWDREMLPVERERVASYISEQKVGQKNLERQPDRRGADAVRRQLNIQAGKKVLVVPLQRLGDTVTRYFAGPIKSYDHFLDLIQQVIDALQLDWTVVVKAHPLEDWCPLLRGVVHAHEQNITDLLDIADAVLTFNSGTGLIATMWDEKPVLCAGEAFYTHEGIAAHTPTLTAVLHELEHPTSDREKRLRFLHYLIHEFYSFGTMETRPVLMPDGARMTATVGIDFRSIRGLTPDPILFAARSRPVIDTKSILFDRYRTSMRQPIPTPSFERLTRKGRLSRKDRFIVEMRKVGEILRGQRSLVPRRFR